MKGGTLIISSNDQILDEFKGSYHSRPVFELHVDQRWNFGDSEGSNYSSGILALKCQTRANYRVWHSAFYRKER